MLGEPENEFSSRAALSHAGATKQFPSSRSGGRDNQGLPKAPATSGGVKPHRSPPRQVAGTRCLTSRRHMAMVIGPTRLRSLAVLFILALATGLAGCKGVADARTAPSAGATASRPVAKPAENECLDCHGPFDQLIADTAKYTATSGEKTSPHRYVPHDSKLAKDIPACSQCHPAHSLSSPPSKGSIDLSKVSVEWCYSCHHEKTFQSCKDCHP